MLNAIPVLGWLLSFLFSVSLSIPFYFLWNGLAPIYFYWMPKVYLDLPFWHCVGLFMLMPMVKALVFPKLVSASSSSDAKKD